MSFVMKTLVEMFVSFCRAFAASVGILGGALLVLNFHNVLWQVERFTRFYPFTTYLLLMAALIVFVALLLAIVGKKLSNTSTLCGKGS